MMKGTRGPRSLKSDPKVGFTQVTVAGLNGAGLIDLTAGTVLGPFVPKKGDLVTGICVTAIGGLSAPQPFDDDTGFASVVGESGTLRQYDTTDNSGTTFLVSIARIR